MRVDAHQHFWRVARGDYGWLPAHPNIHRDFLPNDLIGHLRTADIECTVLVQAAPTVAETRFLLDLARVTPFVAGVVGWTDFDAPGAPDDVARLAMDRKLLGLRPMIQDLPADDWMLSSELAPVFKALTAAGLRFDALVKPGHLPHLIRLLDRHPDLRVVVDHGAKPFIASGVMQPWAAQVATLAKETRAYCKLSGLVTEASENWREEDLKPYVEVLLEAFGPARLMWGSDWPVVNEAGGYARWHGAATDLTKQLSPEEREAIFGRTAKTFYGIGS